MDGKVRELLTDVSIYVKGLDFEARKRYSTKLLYDKGTKSLPDPYNIRREKWSSDLCLWPDLQFAQIFMYLIETPALFSHAAMKNFKSLEAYRYVVSGHVQAVMYIDVPDSPFCFLKSSVLPSMKTRDRPHEAWVCLSKTSADVFCAHCTCMAGLGETCSHVAAILYKIHLAVQSGLTKKSVTSEARLWNNLFKTEVQPSTVEDMQQLMNSNRKKTVTSVVSSSRDPLPSQEVLQSLYSACPNASFFTLIPPLHPDQETKVTKIVQGPNLPPLLTALYDKQNLSLTADEIAIKSQNIMVNTNLSHEQIENVYNKTKTQNISSLWYQHRKGRVTGTKAHDILTRRETTCPDNLTMRILDYKSYNLNQKEAVRWGLDTEAKARDIYAKHYNELHSNFCCSASGLLISEKHPFFGATADGVVNCSCCGVGTLEIKCPFKHKNISVQEAASSDKGFCLTTDMKLKTNHRYFTQIQFQMLVYGSNYSDFVVFTLPESGPSMAIIRVSRDNKFIEMMSAKCKDFVQKHVIPELLTSFLKNREEETSVPINTTLWCLCLEPEYGKMIRCDSDDCTIGWFHYACVNVKRKPRNKWFCPMCKK